jgi:uncharacterized protein
MRQLGRQAGSALTQTRTVPAPDDLRLELIEVPAGADIALEVRFEAVSEGVLATGTAIAPLAGECARCLAPLTSSVTVDLLDLEPAFRDAVVLALPMSPLCREDCPGLCAECGVPLADAGPGHRHDAAVDPRWAALQQLSEQGDDEHQDRRTGAIDLQEG